MTDLAVHTEGLTRRFGAFVAVDRIDLQVPRGSIYGFLGPNGAGKTTTIRILTDVTRPSSGAALLGGADVARNPVLAKVPDRGREPAREPGRRSDRVRELSRVPNVTPSHNITPFPIHS